MTHRRDQPSCVSFVSVQQGGGRRGGGVADVNMQTGSGPVVAGGLHWPNHPLN